MKRSSSPQTVVDLAGDPNLFPNTGIAWATRVLADRVNWLAVVDQVLPWDPARARIAPSVVLLMLVINVLTQQNPLYHGELWAESLPLPILWGEEIPAHQFNDDALGRVLEDLAAQGRTLLATLGPRMRAVPDAGPPMMHTDTTAFALFGDYPNADTGPTAPMALTWGHSKDHRPDLRPVMAGLTMDAEGCVLGGTMLAGNTSDRAWHPKWLDQLAGDFPEEFWKDSYYIADSALITEPALQKIRALGMHWIGRLPAPFGLCEQLKDQAWVAEDAWDDRGALASQKTGTPATYRAQILDTVLYDEPVRAFVYHSRALDRKTEQSLQREVAKEAETVAQLAKKLAKQVFHCAEDAGFASDHQAARLRWHPVTPVIPAQTVSVRTRGRQKAGTIPPTTTEYTVQWQWTGPSAEQLQREREWRSTWVLLTSDRTRDAVMGLRAYKGQAQDELGFRWMKSPVPLTACFLEKPSRVAGLGYGLLLALQFARLMRAMVRHAMADQPPLELPDPRQITQSSETVILEALRTLWVERRTSADDAGYQWTPVKPHAWRILEMLEVPIEHRFHWEPSG